MRKFNLCLLILFVIGCLTYAGAEEAANWMPDAALRQAIRETLQLPAAVPLTKEEMLLLEYLDANHKGITDLTGLAFAINLRELHLGGTENNITDLQPLAALTALVSLHIWDNKHLSDIRPLAGLVHLESLSLAGNAIRDISPLANLKKLQQLHLGDNRIEAISPLSALTALRELHIPRNSVTDITPLATLTALEDLHIGSNRIVDISPLAGLRHLRKLDITENPIQDLSSLIHLNLTDTWICETPGAPTAERIRNRTFPSIALPGSSLVTQKPFLTWLAGQNYYEDAAKHDIHHYSTLFGMVWHLTVEAPAYGLSTRLSGDVEHVMSEYQEYTQRNPNLLFLPTIEAHIHQSPTAYPKDSEYWLRDAAGQIIKNDVPWDEYTIDILNPEVQQLLIERIVGLAECGLFDGVMFDAWAPYHIWFYREYFNIEAEVVIQAYITLLKGIRARVRDDFLILVNRNRQKSQRYAAWINGSFMETNVDYPGGYTYNGLIEIEDALLWNEENLREPRINILQGEGINAPVDGPENLRWMRVFTTMSLTHSDGYCIFRVSAEIDGYIQGVHIWYDFWDADLGQPIGEKAQRYENTDGLFIREFTHGWAVYNRSGKTQQITFTESTTAVSRDIKGYSHTLPDLDGEIYLKTEAGVETPPTADVNGDGVVNIQDLVIVANAFGEAEPDLNGDGTVNIQDLVIVANAF